MCVRACERERDAERESGNKSLSFALSFYEMNRSMEIKEALMAYIYGRMFSSFMCQDAGRSSSSERSEGGVSVCMCVTPL